MKKLFVLILILILAFKAESQVSDSITFEWCYEKALKNYPALKQKNIYSESAALKLKNIRSSYYPKLDINAQATYQSDVTKVTVPQPEIKFNSQVPAALIPELMMPAMDEPSKDQYKISLDVSQLIWDGGISKAQKYAEMANLAADTQKVEVELYQLKEKINQMCFSILMFQEKEKLADILISELKEKIKSMESAIKNGVALPSAADMIQAEIMKIEQQKIEINYAKIASYKMLSEFVGEKISENSGIRIPKTDNTISQPERPEHKLFDMQMQKIEASQKILFRKNYPKLFGFAQLGYGKPGLNMFKKEFDEFYIIGAKLTWNIWDWKQTSNEVKIMNFQKDIIATQKEIFNKNLQMLLLNEQANIEKFQALIKKDEEIIELRSKIMKRSASQLENGIITANEYLTDVNNETQAKLGLNIHKLQLIQAKINYKTLMGK
mgnify:CR=1 FL=1